MKWIGQHIYDLIARFRDDVYLEDISTGTIASGGNLGLDSNNKIVKADEATGDITSVTFQTDSGALALASDASGDALFRLEGSSGVGITNSGTVITAVAVPGEIDHDSLLNFASNEHFTQANITTVGTIDTGVWNGTAIGGNYIAATQPNIDSIGTDGDTLAILADQLHMSNATADMPTVKLTNTTNDDAGPSLVLEKLRDDDGVAQGQNLGEIWFRGQDAGTNTEDYAYIIGEIDVSSHGQESGQLKLGVANHDGGNGVGLTLTGGSEDNEIDVTVGLGTSSVTTVAGNLDVVGSIRGKQIQIISANFKDNQGTAETFLPLAGVPDEKTSYSNEQTLLLMPSGGNVKEIIVRANYNAYTSENIVFKVYTRAANKKVNGSSQIGSDITIAAPTQNTTDSNNTRSTGEITHAYVAGDMLGISMTHQSTGPVNSNDRTYVTVVLENDLTDLSY
jgi:hypothetical protein